MKLAEALIERADLQTRLSQLDARLHNNAKVQEGETPAEDPNDLLRELDRISARLEQLITAINLTNASVTDGGETLTALLARRDVLKSRVGALRNFLNAASSVVMRGSRSEVVIRSTVDVTALRREVDARAMELRKLDTRIQALNWTADLLE